MIPLRMVDIIPAGNKLPGCDIKQSQLIFQSVFVELKVIWYSSSNVNRYVGVDTVKSIIITANRECHISAYLTSFKSGFANPSYIHKTTWKCFDRNLNINNDANTLVNARQLTSFAFTTTSAVVKLWGKSAVKQRKTSKCSVVFAPLWPRRVMRAERLIGVQLIIFSGIEIIVATLTPYSWKNGYFISCCGICS